MDGNAFQNAHELVWSAGENMQELKALKKAKCTRLNKCRPVSLNFNKAF